VRIVFEAAKYGATLITGEWWIQGAARRILGNREKLKDLVRIVCPRIGRGVVQERSGSADEFNARVVGNTAATSCLDGS